MRLIPTRTDLTNYEVTVELDGVDFDLRFLWNDRDETWYLTISETQSTTIDADTGEKVPLLAGVPVLIGVPLLRVLRGSVRPSGELVAYDTTNLGRAPGLTDLGSRVQLFYVEASELVT